MSQDMLNRPIRVLERIIVPDSHDAEAFSLEPSRALSIMRRCDRVLATIGLDDQLPLEAHEIDDILADRSLPPEFHTIALSKRQA
jgi:hypothetical protein